MKQFKKFTTLANAIIKNLVKNFQFMKNKSILLLPLLMFMLAYVPNISNAL